MFLITVCLLPLVFATPYKNPHFWSDRNTIVQLFEWKWLDIANECEQFLQHRGYAAVQISPPNENLIIEKRPWWERYQPVSYLLSTRSGDEEAFKSMTTRCNTVGIRIYVDLIINHMSAGDGVGTAGNTASKRTYPGVPYTQEDFHTDCSITNFNDKTNARNCQLVGLADLDQGREHVRARILDYMNHLVSLGVAGFRVDAARHMWPSDLKDIYSRVANLNTSFGFEKNSRPFIYQEVSNMDREYSSLGRLVEFKHGSSLSNLFQRNDKLKWLVNWGPEWGLINGEDAVVMIENHDTQRDSKTLSYKNSKPYKMAVGFMLAHPFASITKILSSYDFKDNDQGPPSDEYGNVVSADFNPDNTCTKGWICEHRWRQIYRMVEFRNVVADGKLNNWWSNGDQQISFCRGNRGFVVFSSWGDIDRDLQTCLEQGEYCDVVSGERKNGSCTGKKVMVREGGVARIRLGALEEDGFIAIHKKSKL